MLNKIENITLRLDENAGKCFEVKGPVKIQIDMRARPKKVFWLKKILGLK